MKIKQFFYGGDNLAYLLFTDTHALTIDGGAVDEILAYVAQTGLTLGAVTNTHGHPDHARPGMGSYLATDMAAPVLYHRLGDISLDTVAYSETRRIGGASVSFHPAGHVPGSAQIRVEVAGEVWVVSGDYKIEDDGLSTPFEPVPCHHFVTESTFGLPVFRWQPQSVIATQINDWWARCAADGKTAFLGCYSLGKAQRLLSLLDPAQGPILTHGAIETTTQVLRDQGLSLPATIHARDPKAHAGAIVLAPPSALGSAWARKFGASEDAFASGWMALRGIRRRRAGDRGFVISDHADWPGLLDAITATGAQHIHVTHGYTEIFSKYLNTIGLNADIVPTQFEGETLEASDAA
jgi:putative mRNA 3-end processing factor